MPVKRAGFKALRQNQKRRASNLREKNQLKKLNVQLRKAVAAKDSAKAQAVAAQFVKALDKAVKHKIVHRNVGARKKSRIANAVKHAAA